MPFPSAMPLTRRRSLFDCAAPALIGIAVSFAFVVSAATSSAQTIPIRRLTVVASTDSGVVTRVDAIHVLPGGRVLLNDGGRRRLLVFDSTLKRFSIAADTTGTAPVNYGEGMLRGLGNGAILPFI